MENNKAGPGSDYDTEDEGTVQLDGDTWSSVTCSKQMALEAGFSGAGVKRRDTTEEPPWGWGPALSKRKPGLSMMRAGAAADMRPPGREVARQPWIQVLCRKASSLSQRQRDEALLFLSKRIEGAD